MSVSNATVPENGNSLLAVRAVRVEYALYLYLVMLQTEGPKVLTHGLGLLHSTLSEHNKIFKTCRLFKIITCIDFQYF